MEIQAPPSKVYEILVDESLAVKWNLSINSQEELDDGSVKVHSTIGDMVSRTIEDVKNKRIAIEIEGSIFNKMGYILKPIKKHTKIIGWAEFDDEDNRKVLVKAGTVLLESLKRFVEYVEDGGDIEEFDKNKILVSP